MNIFKLKNLVFTGLFCMMSILTIGQDVEHDIVKLISKINGQAQYEFQSSYVPYLSGPSGNFFGGNLQISHISGERYMLMFNAGSNIIPEGWVSDFVFYPFGNLVDYSVQRVRLVVQESVIETHDDFYRVEKNNQGTVLDVLSNDISSDAGLKVNAVTIINNAGADVHHQSGVLTFTPKADFEGVARLQYLACDDLGTCAKGMVSVLVHDPNQTVVSDTIRTTSVNGELIQMPLPQSSFAVSKFPAHSTSIYFSDGIFYYRPNSEFIGKDTMTVHDGADFYRTLIVESISVTMGNGFVQQDVFYPIPNHELTLDAYENDFYSILALNNYTEPAIGTLEHNGLGSFTFIPPTDFLGHTSFNYTVCNGSICETATVYLFVGKQEPRKDIEYHFVTPNDVTLPIDFENDLDPAQYTLSILSEPEYGTVGIFPFYLDPCETFNILKNYIIFEPNQNDPVGDVSFDVLYCLNEVNICDTVTIRVTTELDLGASCECTEDCVWPGDSNNDGYVDVSDLLMVGYNIGQQGVARGFTQDNWQGYHVDNWIQQENTLLDGKYADTDGDGLVSQADTAQIVENYKNVRSLVAKKDHVLEAIPFELYNEIYNTTTHLDSGDLVTFDVLLGTYDLPALDVLGVSFTIDIEGFPVDQNSVRVDFNDNGWLINGSPKLDLDILTDTSVIDAGITRLDQSAASGYGQVARLDFIIVDDLDGARNNGQNKPRPLTVRLTNGSAVTSSGQSISLPDAETTIYVSPRNNNQTLTDRDLIAFPNPSSDELTVHLNGVNEMQSYRIFNISGQLISQGQLTGKRDKISVNEINNGLYILQVMTVKGPIVQKIQVAR